MFVTRASIQKYFFIILFGVLFFILPTISHAQFSSTAQDVVLSIDPLMPLPGESVRVFLSSNLYDLNSYTITWRVDGEVVNSGTGTTSITVTAPFKRSDAHIVEARLIIDGRTLQKVVQVQGRNVVILEQSSGTAFFPGYRGRKVPTREENLKIVAIPDESFSPSVDYTWDKNYITGLPNLSGTGKNSFVIPASIFLDIETLGLEAEDLETRRKMRIYKDLSFEAPFIGFYSFTAQNNPNFLQIISNNFELNKRGVVDSILAYPFGFGTSILKNQEITWSIGGEVVEEYQNNLVIPLKNDDSNSSGNINLIAEIDPESKLSQYSTNAITVSY